MWCTLESEKEGKMSLNPKALSLSLSLPSSHYLVSLTNSIWFTTNQFSCTLLSWSSNINTNGKCYREDIWFLHLVSMKSLFNLAKKILLTLGTLIFYDHDKIIFQCNYQAHMDLVFFFFSTIHNNLSYRIVVTKYVYLYIPI